jgi:hypothetical protein
MVADNLAQMAAQAIHKSWMVPAKQSRDITKQQRNEFLKFSTASPLSLDI